MHDIKILYSQYVRNYVFTVNNKNIRLTHSFPISHFYNRLRFSKVLEMYYWNEKGY